jgi:hypothetical protein
MAGAGPAFNAAKTAELLRIIPEEIEASAQNELHLPDAFQRMAKLIKEGADPSGGPNGSTLKVVIDATSSKRKNFHEMGLAFMELLLKKGANPNHTYQSFYMIRKPYLDIVDYDSEWKSDADAVIFKSWFELLGKYGFDFKQPDLVATIIVMMMDNRPSVAAQRISKTIEYFASHGAPMDGVEEAIDEDFAAYSGNTKPESIEKMKNTLRRDAFMGMGIGSDPTLPPQLKAKVASYAFRKGGRRKRTKKSRVRRNARSTRHK